MDRTKRIKDLVEMLNSARELYYEKNISGITNYEYDTLFDELATLEKETGIILANSPTQTVGYEIKSKLQKVAHEYPMLSLDKTKSVTELKKFVGNHEALLMLKLDGLTVAVTYENGVMVRAESRGNGTVGEDITHNAKTFINLPTIIPYKDKLVVFGEAIITTDYFEKLNNKLPEDKKHKNPRNLASGSVRQLDSKICAERNVRFIAWRLVEGSDSSDFGERLVELDRYGFEIVPSTYIKKDELAQQIEKTRNIAEMLGYPIDGCVVSYRDVNYIDKLGATSHHLRGQLAFKFYDEEVVTVLKGIEWGMGRYGTLTPVAVFEPVDIDGTTVERASLHNVSVLTRLDLHVGDEITVYKANMIIPQVGENLSAKYREPQYIELPSHCPYCGAITELRKDKESIVMHCTNKDCIERKTEMFANFVSKEGMDIKGLSKQGIKALLTKGLINDYKDLYHLKIHRTELVNTPPYAQKSADNLLKAIEKSSNCKLQNFIVALGIPSVGTGAAKQISKVCKNNVHVFLNSTLNYQLGNVAQENITRWLNENHLLVEELITLLEFEHTNNNLEQIYKGLTFCITGSLVQFSNRKELVSFIEQRGGTVTGSVSKNTDYLINNDMESTSSKNQKAKSLGIPIISEDWF